MIFFWGKIWGRKGLEVLLLFSYGELRYDWVESWVLGGSGFVVIYEVVWYVFEWDLEIWKGVFRMGFWM